MLRSFQHIADCLHDLLPNRDPLIYLFRGLLFLMGRHGSGQRIYIHWPEDSAPPKLPATHGPPLDPNEVRHCKIQEWYFILRLHTSRNRCFKVCHLCYARIPQCQYEAIVKLLGSFRLTTGIRHLHRKCIFTERVLETVSLSLHHSCTSELTRQGITLFDSLKQREGPYLVPLARSMTYGLSFESCWTKYELLHTQVTWCFLFTHDNRPSPSPRDPKVVRRTLGISIPPVAWRAGLYHLASQASPT